jgi:hypothetical protein
VSPQDTKALGAFCPNVGAGKAKIDLLDRAETLARPDF